MLDFILTSSIDMESALRNEIKKGSKILLRNVVPTNPKFKLNPMIAEELDPVGVYSQIPPKLLLIHDIRSFYHYSI